MVWISAPEWKVNGDVRTYSELALQVLVNIDEETASEELKKQV